MANDMNRIAAEWLAARQVIMDCLQQLRPDLSRASLEHNAAAIIARLASHDPPILLTMHDGEAGP